MFLSTKEERAKSLNEIYIENGIELFSPFHGDHPDISFGERVLMHWRDLEHREPTLKIACRNFTESPQPGLHNWGCPDLLWEMMRIQAITDRIYCECGLDLLRVNGCRRLFDDS